MSQPPGSGDGTGGQPARDPRPPGGAPGGPGLRLADFGKDGARDTRPPGPALVTALDALSGADRRCAGATDDELTGLLGRWAAAESWATAGKLGVARELLRRRAVPGTVRPGGLPEIWEDGTGHEAAAALAVSVPGADTLLNLAWTLEARLPGTGGKLADGTITSTKAKIIAGEPAVLDDTQAAAAGKLILADLAGKTPGQVGKLAAQAVVTVDPDGAAKRRERAERDDARVRLWREHTGATALAACGLPAGAALAANANIEQRAGVCKKSRAFPGHTIGQLRVLAFCDILNGVTAGARIARAQAQSRDRDRDQPPAGAPAGRPEATAGNPPADDRPAGDDPAGGGPGSGDRDGNGPGNGGSEGPGTDGPDGSGPGNGPDGGPGGGPAAGPPAGLRAAGQVPPDLPPRHPARPGRAARRRRRPRPPRPGPGPRPGRRGRPQPAQRLVPHHHRHPRARHRPRLRHTRENQASRRPAARHPRRSLDPHPPG